MFNPFLASESAKIFQNLLNKGEVQDSEAESLIIDFLTNKCNYKEVTPELRELLAFALGFFLKGAISNNEIERIMGIRYSKICSDIANGHIKLK
ncbi:MAG: hypothetical protein R3B60_02710 [Candidatus Paceibacterota bacterium]